MKKHSTLASNTSSFNGCLRLTCFIVAKLIIYSVYHHNNENPRRSTYLLGLGSGFGEPDNTPPTTNCQEYPRIWQLIIDRVHVVDKEYRSGTPLHLPNRYLSEIWFRVKSRTAHPHNKLLEIRPGEKLKEFYKAFGKPS